MVQLSVKTNFPAVMASLDRLQADVASKALASAVNRTLEQARTAMGREIVAEYAVSAAYVRARLRLRRATSKRGAFSIEGSLIGGDGKRRAANIVAFLEKFVGRGEIKRRRKAGTIADLFFKIKRKGGKKSHKGAFLGNKGRTVFERVGKGRLPIKPVQTIDVPQMFNQRRINRVVVKFMEQKFPLIVDREVAFFVDRFNRGAQ